jgi:hypothetical protein
MTQTIGLSFECGSERLSLAHMTAEQVVLAVQQQTETEERLDAEAEEAHGILARVRSGDTSGITRQQAQEAAARLRSLAEAVAQTKNLLTLMHVAMPAWKNNPDLSLQEAVQRFWPR